MEALLHCMDFSLFPTSQLNLTRVLFTYEWTEVFKLLLKVCYLGTSVFWAVLGFFLSWCSNRMLKVRIFSKRQSWECIQPVSLKRSTAIVSFSLSLFPSSAWNLLYLVISCGKKSKENALLYSLRSIMVLGKLVPIFARLYAKYLLYH